MYACVVTLLVSDTVASVVSSVVMYMFMRRKYGSTPQDATDKVLYEQVHSPNPSITMNDSKCQKYPAYDVAKVIMDAYESYSYK